MTLLSVLKESPLIGVTSLELQREELRHRRFKGLAPGGMHNPRPGSLEGSSNRAGGILLCLFQCLVLPMAQARSRATTEQDGSQNPAGTSSQEEDHTGGA